jgi:ubiquinone/menaquinone biosynthesis C-methylase UbiE
MVHSVEGRSGHYPLQFREGELRRLQLQSDAFAADTDRLLDAVGVGAGWHCIDIACGPKGITDVLSARAGPTGRVVGFEYDPEFVEIARSTAAPKTEFIVGDAYRTGLAEAQFDFAHMRFLASTAGDPETLVAETARLLRPGGAVAFQEAYTDTLRCFPPVPEWDQMRGVLQTLMPETSGSYPAVARIYGLLRELGFENVTCKPVVLAIPQGDPWQNYLPDTVESVRSVVTGKGLFTDVELDQMIARCREHLDQPATFWTSFTVLQIWGTKPG